ncbi:NAD+ synthase [Pontivivens insulae]|uniref:Glutamine-dependent NAD(+) synthetase n=1 Tax=Pontivivens insulae TaxID=1639689 RepID=A0A2R8A8D6_9RHOB|nr:NAD+ synthase [Pontivivens insulae]RED18595.1 NAD+ synthase [Pontivivens insulae]SPF28493.1 Glutamine-dependent NAD(+) synthetase [Pontivivens insulae]
MSNRFRLLLGQLDPVVGDIPGNINQARALHAKGAAADADFVALPEMFATGYQTVDLGRKSAFVAEAMAAVEALAVELATGPALGIGAPYLEGADLYNAYYILKDGAVSAIVKKQILPNDSVFDEHRLFTPAPPQGPVNIAGLRVGIPICEDSWHEGPTETLEESGAEILVIPNGSPYHRAKHERRMNHMVSRVVESGLPLVYLNMVGGQDDQVFDGTSFVLQSDASLAVLLPSFDTVEQIVDFERGPAGWQCVTEARAPLGDDYALDYRAMVESIRSYWRKTGFKKALLGMSGGVDSALTATIAADALGPENVRCVMLPSEYTSQHSLEDAEACATALGCHYDYVPISGPRAAVTDALAPLFAGTTPDVTEENIQSRLRGLLLMALSNKFGEMLLTTGNKSEVAVGYATIYGDMSGGYNPLKDLYKTRVFETCRWRNANHDPAWMKGNAGEVIPTRIIDKPPSAELREDQKDEDSLPPYEDLDAMLEILIEQEGSVADCVAAGFDHDTAKRVEHLLYISEYKRFQSAPGTRLSTRAFWLDRRYPIANRWRSAK